jgi:hypothetical protein
VNYAAVCYYDISLFIFIVFYCIQELEAEVNAFMGDAQWTYQKMVELHSIFVFSNDTGQRISAIGI